MKLNVGDVVTVKMADATFIVRVEDASKSDIIMGKIEAMTGMTPAQYQLGKVHEFDRSAIEIPC